MSDNTVRLSMVGQIVRWRWRLLAVLAAVGALVGAAASLIFSPGYETSTSVLLQGPREPDELVTETQVAMSTVVLDRAAAAIDWDVSGTELQESVTADVADGNVIAVSGTAHTPERARQLADQVAQEYVTYSAQLRSDSGEASAQVIKEQQETLRRQITQTNDRITQLHDSASLSVTVESVQARTELEALRTSLNQAIASLEEAETASSRANMVVMGPAPEPSEAAPTLVHLVGGGAVSFVLLGVLGHLLAARADRRLRDESEIAAALGSGVIGSLDVPAATGERPTGWPGKLARLLLIDVPWQDANDSHAYHLGRDVRYRRALTRLRDEFHARRVLVLVPHGDATAHATAERLVRTDHDGPALQLTEVTPARPTVPEPDHRSHVDGVVVVVTSGTRTAWELVEIADACVDAGQRVLGAVVTHPVWSTEDDEGEPAREDERQDEALAGSS